MPEGPEPHGHADPGPASASPAPPKPADVVVSFLRALEHFELDAALELVHDDLVYVNVTLPTLRGRDRLEQVARPVLRPGRMGFRVHLNHVATEGNVVLTDRIDELNFRRYAMRFWVYGRFVVREGRIALWRDSFDWLDIVIGALRGLIGLAWPAFNRRLPGDDQA